LLTDVNGNPGSVLCDIDYATHEYPRFTLKALFDFDFPQNVF